MPRKPKRPDLSHCKVKEVKNPRAPYRVWFPSEGEGGKVRRIFKSFASEQSAWDFAEEKERELANHGVRYGDIPPEARRAYDFYRDEAERLAEAGAAVPRFEDLVADGLAELRRQHREAQEGAVEVCEAVEQFLDYKQGKVGQMQLQDLRSRLNRFAKDFGNRAMSSISTQELERWLAGLRSRRNPEKLKEPPLLSPLSRNHYRANLFALFRHGAKTSRGWCERNPLADLEPEAVKQGEPKAYSVEDSLSIIQTAVDQKPELVPVVALGLFCGLRVSEAQDFDLGNIGKADEVRVTGKTDWRVAPLTETFRVWFETQKRRRGKAWQSSRRKLASEMQELLALAEVQPIRNGLRHSFISYRCADTRHVPKVADECGNSVQIIRKHYRQLVTSEEAEKFFALRPVKKAENVTKLEAERRVG